MNQAPREYLLHAYDLMRERVHALFEKAETQTLPNLEEAIKHARDKAVELDEITREDAHEVADYLKRDLQEMVSYVNDESKTFGSWFRFDLTLIEDRIIDLVSSIADKTNLELAALTEQNLAASIWHTGEITSAGTLACIECEQEMHFKKTSHIPPCPKCHKTQFQRVESTENGAE